MRAGKWRMLSCQMTRFVRGVMSKHLVCERRGLGGQYFCMSSLREEGEFLVDRRLKNNDSDLIYYPCFHVSREASGVL